MNQNTITAGALSLWTSGTDIQILVMALLIMVAGVVAVTGVVIVLLIAPLAAVAIRRRRTKRTGRPVHSSPEEQSPAEARTSAESVLQGDG
ncbi:hypothetical protein [Arthrobacter sp. MA-N2]|uniref:hypothetical protein n=1 Tax=Arthrobacter sp. MA-N2 TaxID=1101188 RepID=UPI000488BB23|nr:hypothetical protein [Arthrobacter sp. MA-N2]